jgi:tRNA(adenine34) deaminase
MPLLAMTDEECMQLALDEARMAARKGEVPVGCVLVARGGAVIARGHNLRETTQDPTAHAEILALREAAAARDSWRLDDVTAYVTLEPCPMCAGALVNARVAALVYGCDDPKAGAVRTLFTVGDDPRLNHRYEVRSGVRGDECGALLREFFARLRGRFD